MVNEAADTSTPSQPPSAPAKPTVEMPMVFVRGGTTTSAHDMQVKMAEADAERRRNEQDRIRQLSSTPLEQGGGVLLTNNFTPNPQGLPMQTAKILLEYLTPSGEPEYIKGAPLQCLADVMVGLDPAMPTELTLGIVCPVCTTKMPQGQAQIRIRQSNRSWHLDQSKAGELIQFKDAISGQIEVHRSAGMVMESERFSCSTCGWAARIDRNRVWPD